MANKTFRDKLSLALIGLFIFFFFAIHTYAAFCYTTPSMLYDFATFCITFEILGTIFLVVFLLLVNANDRSMPSTLLSVVAVLPCVLVWIVGDGLTPWPLILWVNHVAFWAGYATEFFFVPLSRTMVALYALNTRLRDRRRQPPPVERARGLSRSPSSQRDYAFTELSTSPTLNGSPRDMPDTPVQAAVKDTGEIV